MQNKISESEDEFEMSETQFSEIILRKIAQEIDYVMKTILLSSSFGTEKIM